MTRIANIVMLAAFAPVEERATTCTDGSEVAFALRDEHTGLHYYLERPAGPIDLGWGYDGRETCVLARQKQRTAVVFPFVDPYGGTPHLTIAIVARDRVIEKHDFLRVMCWDLEPVAIRPARGGGWRVEYRCGDDAPIEHVTLDRDGRR